MTDNTRVRAPRSGQIISPGTIHSEFQDQAIKYKVYFGLLGNQNNHMSGRITITNKIQCFCVFCHAFFPCRTLQMIHFIYFSIALPKVILSMHVLSEGYRIGQHKFRTASSFTFSCKFFFSNVSIYIYIYTVHST